jgi:hypothetical protein
MNRTQKALFGVAAAGLATTIIFMPKSSITQQDVERATASDAAKLSTPVDPEAKCRSCHVVDAPAPTAPAVEKS